MDYQLVLQFKGNTILDFDSLVTLEDNLARIVEPIPAARDHSVYHAAERRPGERFDQRHQRGKPRRA